MNEIGGLVNVIPNDKFLQSKQKFEITKKAEKIINFFRFPLKDKVTESIINIFGSYNLKAQPYYADIDTNNFVLMKSNRNETPKIVTKLFQNIVKKIQDKEGWFFTDAKAGIYPDGEAIHWTAEEILKGKRNGKNPDFNGHFGEMKLIDAVKEHALLKIDMVVPYYDKYIETTVVYYIRDKDGPFNYDEDRLQTKIILESLLKDTLKQLKKNKYFKVIKRIFAMLRYTKNWDYIKPIKPLINSNLSKLSAIISDLGTLELLLFLKKPFNVNFAIGELESFKEKLSNILDLNLDNEKIDSDLNKLSNYLLNYDKNNALILLEKIIAYLLKENNKQVELYFQHIGIPFKNYVNNVFKSVNQYLKFN